VHEKNYGSPQGEMLAAVWAIKTFHTYLHGEKFTLVTDHQPLTYLMTKNDLVAMLARWAITLQQYTFDVVHRPGVNHQNADCLSRLPEESSADTTGARLNDEPMLVRSMLCTQFAALHASAGFTTLQHLYDLFPITDFADTFAPSKGDMVSICTDTPITPEMSAVCMHTSSHVYTPTLLHKNLQVDAEITSKGGVLPCLNASFLAGNTTLPPAEFLQETEMQRTSAHEKYYGPSDVWLDTQVLDYIRKGSTAADLPSHDIRRVTRRAKNYLMHDDKLFRLFDSGERKEVPPPHARAEIVRYMHEQHGHW